MILSGRKTVLQAVDEAIRTVRLMRHERERTDRFKGIMDYSFEGILSVNREGLITTANNYAKKVLEGLDNDDAHAPAADILPELDIQALLSGEKQNTRRTGPYKKRTSIPSTAYPPEIPGRW